jgi:hypothetical protein
MSLAQFVGHFIIYAGDRGLRVEFQPTRLSDQKNIYIKIKAAGAPAQEPPVTGKFPVCRPPPLVATSPPPLI